MTLSMRFRGHFSRLREYPPPLFKIFFRVEWYRLAVVAQPEQQ